MIIRQKSQMTEYTVKVSSIPKIRIVELNATLSAPWKKQQRWLLGGATLRTADGNQMDFLREGLERPFQEVDTDNLFD